MTIELCWLRGGAGCLVCDCAMGLFCVILEVLAEHGWCGDRKIGPLKPFHVINGSASEMVPVWHWINQWWYVFDAFSLESWRLEILLKHASAIIFPHKTFSDYQLTQVNLKNSRETVVCGWCWWITWFLFSRLFSFHSSRFRVATRDLKTMQRRWSVLMLIIVAVVV